MNAGEAGDWPAGDEREDLTAANSLGTVPRSAHSSAYCALSRPSAPVLHSAVPPVDSVGQETLVKTSRLTVKTKGCFLVKPDHLFLMNKDCDDDNHWLRALH